MHGHMQRRHADKTLNQQLHLVEDAMLLAGLYRSEWQLQMGMDIHEAMGRVADDNYLGRLTTTILAG